MTLLEEFKLVPTIELEPSVFESRRRPFPRGSLLEAPAEWHQHWHESLADSGITGLTPMRPGLWLVPIRELNNPATIEKVLAGLVKDWGGKEVLSDPQLFRVLPGGLVLCCGEEILVTPTCCTDLGDASDWREAAEYRGSDWQMLWIGHPWISIRFDGEYLVLSEPHESEEPVPRWKVSPDLLRSASAEADRELEAFARRLQPVVAAFCGEKTAQKLARKLVGLDA